MPVLNLIDGSKSPQNQMRDIIYRTALAALSTTELLTYMFKWDLKDMKLAAKAAEYTKGFNHVLVKNLLSQGVRREDLKFMLLSIAVDILSDALNQHMYMGSLINVEGDPIVNYVGELLKPDPEPLYQANEELPDLTGPPGMVVGKKHVRLEKIQFFGGHETGGNIEEFKNRVKEEYERMRPPVDLEASKKS